LSWRQKVVDKCSQDSLIKISPFAEKACFQAAGEVRGGAFSVRGSIFEN
jgi:hypothetical protein